jgi:hypothetical protein
MDKKNIILLVFVCLTSLAVGFILGQFSGKTIDQDNKIEQELAWCKSSLEIVYPPLPEEIYSLGGMVIEKQDNFLIIETTVQVNQFPLPDGKHLETQNIKVNLTDETQVFKQEFVEELMTEKPEGEEPFNLFRKVFFSVEDIEVGKVVQAFSQENIKGQKEFSAIEIELSR